MCGTALPKPLLWNLQCARASYRHASRTRSPLAMHAEHAMDAMHAMRAHARCAAA